MSRKPRNPRNSKASLRKPPDSKPKETAEGTTRTYVTSRTAKATSSANLFKAVPKVNTMFVSLVYYAESTVRRFIMKEKHCWMIADSADKSKRTG
jgi:hypothetical protein